MKTDKFRRLKFRFFQVSFFVITMVYLAVVLVPFLSSGRWWFIAILGLIFPFILVLEIAFLIFWMIKKSKFFFISIVVLLLSWQQLSVMVAVKGGSNTINTKEEGSLRVLSWNVSRWNLGNSSKDDREVYRNLMLDFISLQDADVLCFQEFFESRDHVLYSSTISILEKRGYLYHYFFPSYSIYEGAFEFGLAVFSKFPIISSKSFSNDAQGHSEGFCYTDLKVNTNNFRVFNFHTESPGFGKEDYNEGGGARYSGRLLGKLKNSYEIRNRQAEKIHQEINNSPYPYIVCGDLGDVPNSYAYFCLKGSMRDAFLEKGIGFGRTYRHISPTLRIDYLFVSSKIKVDGFHIPKTTYSDHFPVVSDLKVIE